MYLFYINILISIPVSFSAWRKPVGSQVKIFWFCVALSVRTCWKFLEGELPWRELSFYLLLVFRMWFTLMLLQIAEWLWIATQKVCFDVKMWTAPCGGKAHISKYVLKEIFVLLAFNKVKKKYQNFVKDTQQTLTVNLAKMYLTVDLNPWGHDLGLWLHMR